MVGQAVATDPSYELRAFPDQRYNQRVDGNAGLCDVLLPPTEPPTGGYPTVLVVHGGGWVSGSKWTISGYSRFLANQGYATVTINYRLAPQYRFPAQLDDLRQGLVWIAKHAETYHFNLDCVGLFGYSAGGHLALLLSALQDEPTETKVATSEWKANDPRWIALPAILATCVGGPPCDFQDLPLDNTTLAYFLGSSRRENPKVYQLASPIAHVSCKDPPVRIIHGETDAIVPIQGSVAFSDAIRNAGGQCRLTKLPGQGHLMTFLNPKTSEAVREFFAEALTAND
ncbi:alpha/beta hydrolase [Novipirellula artificiosorum]|nr:alpha/beta hydrolase [Novipirellula artificiosorum]